MSIRYLQNAPSVPELGVTLCLMGLANWYSVLFGGMPDSELAVWLA